MAAISPPTYPLTPAKIFERSQKVKVRPIRSSFYLDKIISFKNSSKSF